MVRTGIVFKRWVLWLATYPWEISTIHVITNPVCFLSIALFASTIRSCPSLVIVLKWPSCTWSELIHSGLTMTNCDHAWPCYIHLLILLTICDQTWPDTARCDQVWLCMHGGQICVWFVGMSVQNHQNLCFVIKSFLKGVYHVIITCCHCMGSISITNGLQQMIWGNINQSQMHT